MNIFPAWAQHMQKDLAKNLLFQIAYVSMLQTTYLEHLLHGIAWQQNVQKRPIWSLLLLYFSIAASEICVFTTKTIYHPLQRPIASLLHDHHLQHHYQIESHYWRALLNLHRHNHHHYHDYQLIIPTSIGKISWYLKTQKYKESYLFQRVVNKHVLEVKG